jgi:hypothetical protein
VDLEVNQLMTDSYSASTLARVPAGLPSFIAFLVSRPVDFVNANPLLRIGVSPAERFC